MLNLIGKPLNQWDTGRKLQVAPPEGVSVHEVHFANVRESCATPIAVVDGVAKIPDKLLQTGKDLVAYAVTIIGEDEQTVGSAMFPVKPRPKPKDYIYTEAEVAISELRKIAGRATKAIESVENTVKDLEAARDRGEFDGISATHSWDGTVLTVTSASGTSSADLKGEKGDTGEQGPQGEKGDKGDKGEVNMDDTAVGPDAWSSKQIIDRLCPTFDENGGCVMCEPVEGYPLEVISKIAAAQAGGGDPGPDNVRPITVHKKLTLTQCGKNLFNKDAYSFSIGYVYAKNGNTTSSQYSNYCYTKDYIGVSHLQGQTITLNHPPAEVGGGNPGMAFYDADQVYISGTNDYTMTVPENAVYMRFSVPIAHIDGSQIQIELGSKKTAYEAYWEKLFSIDLPEGAAAGTYDWNTGLLTVTHKAIDMSTLEWSDENDDNAFLWASLEDAATLDGAVGDKAACSLFCKASGSFSNIISGGGIGNQWDIGDYNETRCIAVCCETTGNDLQAFMDLLESTNAVLVYPLAEQYTVQFDPQQVLALDGVKIIYSDTGDTRITGKADPIAVIEKLTQAVISLGGNI